MILISTQSDPQESQFHFNLNDTQNRYSACHRNQDRRVSPQIKLCKTKMGGGEWQKRKKDRIGITNPILILHTNSQKSIAKLDGRLAPTTSSSSSTHPLSKCTCDGRWRVHSHRT